MLLRFRVANFASIRDEVEFLMTPAPIREEARDVVYEHEGTKLDVLPAAGIYGANASGKSNFLRALGFLKRAVVESHREWPPTGGVPRTPFLLDGEGTSRPSSFEVEFLQDDIHYVYGFEVDSHVVLREWLHAYPHGRRQAWFRRDTTRHDVFSFGKNLKGPNRSIQELTRQNSLFLSTAVENNHEQLGGVYSWFADLLGFYAYSPTDSAALSRRIRALQIRQKGEWLLNLVRAADLGIVDLDVLEELPREQLDVIRKSIKGMAEMIKSGLQEIHDEGAKDIDITQIDEALVHFTMYKIAFRHAAAGAKGGVAIPFEDESGGTKAWLSLACHAIEALDAGGVLCVDELDTSLHPHLASAMIRLFQDPGLNPRHAQLIFTTHDTNLLGDLRADALLRRDQVWITEKDPTGGTHLYPLTDFRPRKHENLERGYLQGRYGGIPVIDRRWLRGLRTSDE